MDKQLFNSFINEKEFYGKFGREYFFLKLYILNNNLESDILIFVQFLIFLFNHMYLQNFDDIFKIKGTNLLFLNKK